MTIIPNRVGAPNAPTPLEIADALARLDACSIAPGVWTARLSTGQQITITDPSMVDVYAAAVTLADRLDADHGAGTAELAARVLRVHEAAGAVARMWIGAASDGETYSYADVCGALADVVLAALVAMESLNGDQAGEVARAAARALARIGGAA